MTDDTNTIGAAVLAAATEAKFRNPALAARLVNLAGLEPDDDSPDSDEITSRLAALADSDPYLVAAEPRPRPKPDNAQGGTGGWRESSVGAGRRLFEERHAKKTGSE